MHDTSHLAHNPRRTMGHSTRNDMKRISHTAMPTRWNLAPRLALLLGIAAGAVIPPHVFAQEAATRFHQAPLSVDDSKNPYANQPDSITAGKAQFAAHCAACHGASAEGTGNVPALASARV